MNSRELELMLSGWSLTTAEILYRMPDHLDFLQTFVWQEYDLAPRFPRLIKYLDFWKQKIEGPLVEVRVMHNPIIGAAEMRMVGFEWKVH